MIVCLPACRGRRGSQGSEPYSPYDFSEEQEVPESKSLLLFKIDPVLIFHIYRLLSSSVVQARTPKAAKPGRGEEEAMDTTVQADADLPAER